MVKKDGIYIFAILILALFIVSRNDKITDLQRQQIESELIIKNNLQQIESMKSEMQSIQNQSDYQRELSEYYAHQLDSINGIIPISYPKLDTASSSQLQHYFISRYK